MRISGFSAPIAIAVFITVLGGTRVSRGFTFDDVEFWVGTGANRAALAIDWVENTGEPPALVWGYRWDGAATGYDMLLAIVRADDRLYAKFGDSFGKPVVYGLGYDTDNDGVFGARKITLDGTPIDTGFDDDGIATSEIPDEDFRRATATDAGDYYMEGWFTAFWHYGNQAESPTGVPTNPFDGGSWENNNSGMAMWPLVDGAWDSWAFEIPAIPPPYTAYAENPVAATSPFPPGDFNQDTFVDESDYLEWRRHYGSTDHPAADGNRDGVVDGADYTVWRNNFASNQIAAAAIAGGVPEPATIWLAIFIGLILQLHRIRRKKGSS